MDSNNIHSDRDEAQSLSVENQGTAGKDTWRDKPTVSILAKVFGIAALAVSVIGLVLYCAVDGKGIGIVYKYIIAAWSGCLGVLLGVPGIICSKGKTVKLITIGSTALAALLILLSIASVLNMMVDEENGSYSNTKYSKSYDRTYEPNRQYYRPKMKFESPKDVQRRIETATKAIEAFDDEKTIDIRTIRDLECR